jgi:hypothetical protein
MEGAVLVVVAFGGGANLPEAPSCAAHEVEEKGQTLHATCRYVLRTRTVARDDLAERASARCSAGCSREEATASRERAPRGRAAHACDGGAIAVRLASSRPVEGHGPSAPSAPREGSGVPSRVAAGAARPRAAVGAARLSQSAMRREDTGPIRESCGSVTRAKRAPGPAATSG